MSGSINPQSNFGSFLPTTNVWNVQEIDTLESVGSDQDIQFEQLLSQLQDVDFAKAISDLQRQQLYLQAAQQSYMKISGLTLFNYI